MTKKTAVLLTVWAVAATAWLAIEKAGGPSRAAGPRSPGRTLAAPANTPFDAAGATSDSTNSGLSATEERTEFLRRWMGSRTGTIRLAAVLKRVRTPLEAVVQVKLTTKHDDEDISYEVTTGADGKAELDGVRYPLTYQFHCTAESMGFDDKVNVFVAEDGHLAVLEVQPRTAFKEVHELIDAVLLVVYQQNGPRAVDTGVEFPVTTHECLDIFGPPRLISALAVLHDRVEIGKHLGTHLTTRQHHWVDDRCSRFSWSTIRAAN